MVDDCVLSHNGYGYSINPVQVAIQLRLDPDEQLALLVRRQIADVEYIVRTTKMSMRLLHSLYGTLPDARKIIECNQETNYLQNINL